MPAHNGRANTGPVDLFYLLNRRRVSFARWCHEHGIGTQGDFQRVKEHIEAKGEFFLSQEMEDLARSLPLTVAKVDLPEPPTESASQAEVVMVMPSDPEPVEVMELPSSEEETGLDVPDPASSSSKRKKQKTV